MKNNLKCLLLIIAVASPCKAYEDRFDAPSANWQRANLLDLGSADWSISGGRVNFFTGSSPTSDNQVFLQFQQPFSNSQDWNFQIGMNNSSGAQLQVFVANSSLSDLFGATLKGLGQDAPFWGAEFTGHSYWLEGGITAAAAQQGSIKVDYVAATRTYSLLYFNGEIDPITNPPGSWSLLHTYVTPETGNVNLFIGMQTGGAVADGNAYVDNFKSIPEPSALSLLAIGLAGLMLMQRRFPVVKSKSLMALAGVS